MGVLTLVGRLLVAWLLFASGVGNIVRTGRVAAHVRERGLSHPRGVVRASGALLAVAGLAIALGIWLDVALIGAAVILVAIAVVMHPFWSVAGVERERLNIQFWKDLALAGALLAWLGYVIETGDVPLALTDPLL